MLRKYLKSEIILIESWKTSRKKKFCNYKKQADFNSNSRKEICLSITKFSLCQDEIMKWYVNIKVSELNCEADCYFRTTRLLILLSNLICSILMSIS